MTDRKRAVRRTVGGFTHAENHAPRPALREKEAQS